MNIARSMLLKYFVSKWTVMITSAGMLATMMYHLSSGQLDKVHHMYTILSAVYFFFQRESTTYNSCHVWQIIYYFDLKKKKKKDSEHQK